MIVYLAGTGCGPGTQTAELETVLAHVSVVAGPERLLKTIPAETHAWLEKICAVYPQEILEAIRRAEPSGGGFCVLLSGDSGFFSGARKLLPLLEDYDVRVLPGISSLQVLAARLGRPWQEWKLCSAHGVSCDPVREVCGGRPVFFLTGGKQGPAELCVQLTEAGLGDLPVVVGEDLDTDKEVVREGTAAVFAQSVFSPLSVMLAEAAPAAARRLPGFPDSMFRRSERIPMTKQAIRSVILSQLAPGPEEICWDIGSGTGSVSIELAMQAKAVYGVEQDPEALALAEQNRKMLGAWNLRLTEGTAPEALRDLPAPDAVFVGGSRGNLPGILQAVQEKNPEARICVSAIVLENAVSASSVLGELGYRTEILQIGVSRSRKVGGKHMMTAQNPVLLITGIPDRSSGSGMPEK